jgi:hypothetical protein
MDSKWLVLENVEKWELKCKVMLSELTSLSYYWLAVI